MSESLVYRYTIVTPGASSAYTPGMAVVPSEHFSTLSVRGGTRAYIESPPQIDGQDINLLNGRSSDGVSVIRLLDLQGTVGGGLAVNEEFDDQALYTRWSKNQVGPNTGGFGWGSLLYPTSPPTAIGATAGGSMTVTAGDVVWIQRTFTGLTPSTDYTATLRYFNRGCAAVLGFGPGAPALPGTPFLEAGGTRVYGGEVGTPLVTPPNNPPASYLQVSTMSDGAGNLTVLVGVEFTVSCVIFSWVMGFDWVHLAPGAPAATGRYVTLSLADTGTRQQLLGRQTFLEASYDNGATWSEVIHSGYLTDIRLEKSLVYELTNGDTRRVERVTQVFGRVTPSFDNVSCLIGGPTLHGWDPWIQYWGRPTFVIEDVTASVYDINGVRTGQGEVVFRYIRGPMPESYQGNGDNLDRSNFDLINERARQFWAVSPDVPEKVYGGNNQVQSGGEFARLQVRIFDVNNIWPVTQETFTPWSWYAFFYGGVPTAPQSRPFRDTLMGEGGRIRIPWDYGPPFASPVIGDEVELAVYPLDVSQEYPLHISMHPVDIVTALYDDYNVAYDTTTAATVKAALGQLVLKLRVAAATSMQAFLEQVYGAIDFSTRMDDGERVFTTLRRKAYTPPALTIDATRLREEGGPTFGLSESTKCNLVNYTGRRFMVDPNKDPYQRAWDDIEEKEQKVIVDLVTGWPGTPYRGSGTPTLDAATFGERPASFDLPGQLFIDTVGELPLRGFVRALAESVFDRCGRGQQATTLVTRRGQSVDALRAAEEVGVDIPHHPNAQFNRAPISQRGGTRVATITRRTWSPAGVVYNVVDAGTGSLPFAITPTAGRWSVTQHATEAGIALLDLNADGAYFADLTAANARVNVQAYWGPTQPTTDGALIEAIDPAEHGTNSTFRLGQFGTTVDLWVRIQAFVPGATPSPWSDWVMVGLGSGATGTISSLVVGTETDTTIPLSWTNTDFAQPVTVSYRITGTSTWITVSTLPPGSTQYTIGGLVAATNYDVRVTLPDGTTLTSTGTTTNVGLSQLPTPTVTTAYSDGVGGYGLRVRALYVPATVVYETATETAVGSGVPGSYTEYSRQPAALGVDISAGTTAPNDGKKRYVRAKLSAVGFTDSAYTQGVEVQPWTAQSGGGGPQPPVVGGGVRQTTPITALALASNTDATGTVAVGKGSICWRVKANGPCRVRLYDDAATRTSDAARAINTEAASGAKIVADWVLHSTGVQGLDMRLSPRVILGNTDDPVGTTLYYAITNLSSATADIVVDLYLTPVEI